VGDALLPVVLAFHTAALSAAARPVVHRSEADMQALGWTAPSGRALGAHRPRETAPHLPRHPQQLGCILQEGGQ